MSDFGPQLLAKVLEANETQEQSLGLVFRYADQKGLPLLDLSDLRALLTFLDSDDGKAELDGIGGLSSPTVGVLLRALVGLEDGGGNELFGEPQFDIHDLLRTAPDGRGVISCLELPAVQDKPDALLDRADVAARRAVRGAARGRRPRQAEARLLLRRGAPALRRRDRRPSSTRSTQTVRLIRSKGVGVFFVTQTPKDVPGDVLGQLGNRVQHALRAFTPDDAKALKATVSTFPKSEFYDLGELLPALGIGEAAVTILSESGVPTPVVHTRLCAPASRMGPADDVDGAAKASPLYAKYGQRVDSESAREMLAARTAAAAAATPAPVGAPPPPKKEHREAAKAGSGGVEAIGKFLTSRQGKKLQRQVVRGVFGMLKKRL